MEKLKAKLIAYSNAEIQLFSNAKKSLLNLFHQEKVEFVDKNPDILVFLTGGSERQAIQSVQIGGFYILLAMQGANSWAAATEVKSWMNTNGISSILIDQSDPFAQIIVDALYRAKSGIRKLRGKRFGLIGQPSDWLVNSVVSSETIKAKLGVEQVDIPWADVNVLAPDQVASDFLSFFSTKKDLDLITTGKVYESIAHVVAQNKLNAVTVECFSMVSSCNTTACLALSKLSMDGIPAGCEGDICSILGLMLSKEVCGVIPWMANVAHVKGNRVLLAHCTIPGNLANSFELDSHYETNTGVAINASLRGGDYTVFRLDKELNRMFIAKGTSSDFAYSKNACRTQLMIEFEPDVSEYFLNNPLGNHHLVLPGNYVDILGITARLLMMKIVP